MKTRKKENKSLLLMLLMFSVVSASLRAEITRPSGYTPGFAVTGFSPEQTPEKTSHLMDVLCNILRSALPESGRRLYPKEDAYAWISRPEILTNTTLNDYADFRWAAMIEGLDYVFDVTLNPIGDDHSAVIRLYQLKDSGRLTNTRIDVISELVFSSRHFLGGSSENVYNGINAAIDAVLKKLDELEI